MRQAALALALACGMGMAVALKTARHWSATTNARLVTAAEGLDALTDRDPASDDRRAAIAWGYAERMRLGLESPFRLIESAAADPRLTDDERRTVSWGLLAHVVRGETHEVEPAALDLIGPREGGRSVHGEQHLSLITSTITRAANPRAAELAVRLAYALAAAEGIVDGAAPLLAAEAAALVADREIARREAGELVRSSGNADVMEIIRGRRGRRSFYVERPVLLAPGRDVERAGIELVAPLLDSVRALRPGLPPTVASDGDGSESRGAFAEQLAIAGTSTPPVASLAVTVQRYLPVLGPLAPHLDLPALGRAANAELLVAAIQLEGAGRAQRRTLGRLLLASAVAMRSGAQEPVWLGRESPGTPASVAAAIGALSITFDGDVPAAWRAHMLHALAHAVTDLRRVLPDLKLAAVNIRFRMTAPADSALAMHEPRSRTLHLPALTGGGTLLHELAHELDRQSAVQEGLPGYRSDVVARADAQKQGRAAGGASGERVAASLRALTEDVVQPRAARPGAERPAEIFATRVDWFVAQALARDGISSGFLTGIQDELLTGHVVHPERLRTSGRARSLLDALEGMTSVAPRARQDQEPSVHTLLRWSLSGPVDRRVAADIVNGETSAWFPLSLIADQSCDGDETGRSALVRMAAESRARGWFRQRARWMAHETRPAWARGMLREGPFSDELAHERIAALTDYVLVQLAAGAELPAGLGAYAVPLAARARCS